MERFIGILGIFAILGIAYLMSNNKKNIDLRIVIWGLGLQLLFGIFILVTPFGKPIFSWFDKAIKKLLSFCDLSWSTKCVEFYKSKNSVSTASLAQVRQPIYKTSVAAWESYSSYLEDLKNSLKN